MKIIYLDQNKWIDLLKSIEKPNEYPKYINVANHIKNKVDSGEWIFPLSLTHFMETTSRANSTSREKLADVMSSISKNWSIKSYADIEVNEFFNSFYKSHNSSKKIEIQAVCKNILSAIGRDNVEIKIEACIPEYTKRNMEKLIENSIETLLKKECFFTSFMADINPKELVKKFNWMIKIQKWNLNIYSSYSLKFQKKIDIICF